jgi:hypothetical protein
LGNDLAKLIAKLTRKRCASVHCLTSGVALRWKLLLA